MASSTLTTSHNKKVWDNLNVFVEKAVEDAVEIEAHRMVQTLRKRSGLAYGVIGRYPRDANRKYGQHSFSQWGKSKAGQFRWKITNPAQSVDGYPYPVSLAYGLRFSSLSPMHPWSKGIMSGSPKLVINNGKIFSSQMPNGLGPWLKRKRAIIADTIETEIAKWG